MRSFIEKAKLLSLVASKVVEDEHIADYLQGISYEEWSKGKDLAEVDGEGNVVNIYEDVEADVEAWKKENYAILRKAFYPQMTDYMDAVVKGDEEAQKAYIDACLAIKERFPK